jgi:hypothetical protein
MPNSWKSKEFLDLHKEWNNKLKDADFKDAESYDYRTGEVRLKEWDSFYFQTHNDPEIFLIKQEYYYRAYQFLHQYNWVSKSEQQIWLMHSQGMGVRIISTYLQVRGIKTNKDYIASIVKRLKIVMKEFLKQCEDKILSQSETHQPQIWDSSTNFGSKNLENLTPGLEKSTREPTSLTTSQLSLIFCLKKTLLQK